MRKIPLDVLFGQPGRAGVKLSPDGNNLSYLAPLEGVVTVWIESLRGGGERPVFRATSDVRDYAWTADAKRILFLRDDAGNELTHLFVVEVESGQVRDLTPFDGVTAQNLITDIEHSQLALIGLDRRKAGVFDMYRVALASGELTLEAENPGDVLSWNADGNFQIRACSAISDADASTSVRVRETADAPWKTLFQAPFERSLQVAQYQCGTSVVGFTEGGRHLVVASSLQTNASRVEEYDIASGELIRIVDSREGADVDSDGSHFHVLSDRKASRVQAVRYDPGIPFWSVVDKSLEADFEYLQQLGDGRLEVVSRTKDDSSWLIHFISPKIAGEYYLYQRDPRCLRSLFDEFPQYEPYEFADQELVSITASDGFQMPAYLTMPVEARMPAPMVLLPHGGPWSRDVFGFDQWIQFLANRGYAVLQPQFRGSIGFGLRHLNAATGEWARRMHDDLTNAVEWAVNQGVADPARLAIMGGSYGGYSVMNALTLTPDLFRCGVTISGPVDIGASLMTMKQGWVPLRTRWVRRIGGDPSRDEDLNRRISPLFRIDQVRAPVLVIQGRNDPRVLASQADSLVEALRDSDVDVEYVLYEGEGHSISQPENVINAFERIERFLEKHLS